MESTKRYVWLNLETGEFSQSWSEKQHKECLEVHDFAKYDKMWKLIEYTCVNDPEFVFFNYMKLR